MDSVTETSSLKIYYLTMNLTLNLSISDFHAHSKGEMGKVSNPENLALQCTWRQKLSTETFTKVKLLISLQQQFAYL